MENKEIFNFIASEYEKFRPTYPDEMFDAILYYLNAKKKDGILEIGYEVYLRSLFVTYEVDYIK